MGRVTAICVERAAKPLAPVSTPAHSCRCRQAGADREYRREKVAMVVPKSRHLPTIEPSPNALLCLALLTSLLAACGSASDRRTATGPAADLAPSATTIGQGATEDLEADPTATPPLRPEASSEPVEGTLLWTYRPQGFRVSPLTSATHAAGIIYVGTSRSPFEGQLLALDAERGTVLWAFEHNGHTPSTPTVADGIAYVGSEDRKLYALNATDGSLIWSFETEGHVRSKPLVMGELIIVDSQDGYLYALDAEQGDLIWLVQTDEPASDAASRGVIPVSPVSTDGAVFIVGFDARIMAFETPDGRKRWEYEAGGQVFASPGVDGDSVYAGSLNGEFYALSSSDGSLRWSFRAGRSIASSPAANGGQVFVASNEGILYAFDAADGSVLWKFETESTGLGSPALRDGVVYFGSIDGTLYAVDADDGALLAAFETGESLNRKPPAVVDGVVYVVTTDRSLFAVDLHVESE